MTPSKDGDELCTYFFDIDYDERSIDVPFNIDEWLPVIPEPEVRKYCTIYSGVSCISFML